MESIAYWNISNKAHQTAENAVSLRLQKYAFLRSFYECNFYVCTREVKFQKIGSLSQLEEQSECHMLHHIFIGNILTDSI